MKSPTEYLGAEIRPYTINPGLEPKLCWSMSSDKYVKRAVSDVQRSLDEVGQQLKTKVTTPMSTGYRPELDASAELDDRRANYFQGLIGILRWMVE